MTRLCCVVLLLAGFGCDSGHSDAPPKVLPKDPPSTTTPKPRIGRKIALDDKIRADIRYSVRGGFYDEARLIEIYREELYAPGELDPAELRTVVAKELAALREEQKSWPKQTDCDRLTEVFKALQAKGIIALENAGFTQSDGYEDVMEIYQKARDRKPYIGYCFYQGQDLDSAVRGEGLHLAFGPIDPQKEETEGVRVGKIIVEELKSKGFAVEWEGSFKTRIKITKLDWKRRIP